MKLRLVPVGEGAGSSPPVVLHPGVHRIGRHSDSDFVLSSSGIVCRHCRIRIDRDGVSVSREQSDAALAVNGVPLPLGSELPLLGADIICLGLREFLVEIEPTGDVTEETELVFPDQSLFKMPRPADMFAGHRLETIVGSGGCSVVFAGSDPASGRRVAIKVLDPGARHIAEVAARFHREAMVGGALAGHTGSVAVLEIGRSGRFSYIVMELVDGRDLKSLLEDDKRLSPGRTLEIGLQVADVLRFAHGLGIIHRDVKPGNIMVGADGCAKLLDLGLARHLGSEASANPTRSGQGIGTMEFAAPEQALDASKVDHRADVYSLGATLFAAIAGRPPLVGRSPIELIGRILADERPRLIDLAPDVPVAISEVIGRCVLRDPGARYQDYDNLMRDMRQAARGALDDQQ